MSDIDTAIVRLRVIQQQLRSCSLWQPVPYVEAHHLADCIDRAIANLRGEEPRYLALEATDERPAA